MTELEKAAKWLAEHGVTAARVIGVYEDPVDGYQIAIEGPRDPAAMILTGAAGFGFTVEVTGEDADSLREALAC